MGKMSRDKANADSSLPGVVFHRRNGKRWVVILEASDFLELIK